MVRRYEHEESSPHRALLLLLLLVAVGAIVRLDLLFASDWVIDADEAIVGLMARHLALDSWQEFPIFYYGQHYMGSLEPLLVSLLFRLFGETNSPVLLKLVPFLFSLALIPIIYLLGRRIAGVSAGLVAAAYIAVPPSPLAVWSSMARGGFIEIVLLCAVTLLLAIMWAAQGDELGGSKSWSTTRRGRASADERSMVVTALIGLLLGLGWWTNNQIIYAMLPIGLWYLLQILLSHPWPLGPLLRHGSIGVSAFLVGGLPFWWYNLTHDFVSFEMFSSAKNVSKTFEQVQELFSVALPILFGAKRFWHDADLFPGATAAGWSLALLTFALAVIFGFTRSQRPRQVALDPFALILVYLGTTCLIFSLSSFGWLTTAPRYLLPVYPALAVIVGVALAGLHQRSTRLAWFVGLLVAVLNLMSLYWGGRAVPGQPVVYQGERVAKSHDVLIGWLAARGYAVVETNYWIGYRLAFETDERVIFKIFGEPRNVRIPDYETRALAVPVENRPMILTPKQADAVAGALRESGMSFDRAALEDYVIIYNRRAPQGERTAIDPSLVTATSTLRPEGAKLVFDGDEQTRWGTGQSQRPGQEFSVVFKSPLDLVGIDLSWSKFPPDYPRALEVEARSASGTSTLLLSAEQYRRLRILAGQSSRLELFVNSPKTAALVFRQVGADSVFDWSIGELRLFARSGVVQ